MDDPKHQSSAEGEGSGLLNSLPRPKRPEAPEGYFDEFPARVLSRLDEQIGAPELQESLTLRIVKAKWVQWLAAASVVLALGVAGWQIAQRAGLGERQDGAEQLALSSLETVDEHQIIAYLEHSDISDEDLFLALGSPKDLDAVWEDKQDADAAWEYLEENGLDETDLEGIDFNDLEL